MLSSSILAAFGLRRYPDYVVKRSCRVFLSRAALLAYEEAVITEQQLQELISENTPAHLEASWQLCQSVEVLWDLALIEVMENNIYNNSNYFLARFSAGNLRLIPYVTDVLNNIIRLGIYNDYGAWL
jgi:hypothetical protein